MELSLNLPAQYVDIEQDEMIYLEGGRYTGIAIHVGTASAILGYALQGVATAAVAKQIAVATLCGLLIWGGKAAYTIYHGINIAIGEGIAGFIGRLLSYFDSSGNGWIGIYVGSRGVYTK